MTDDPRLAALADNWLDTILIDYVNRPFGQTEAIACRVAILAALDGWTLVPRMDPQSPDEWIQPAVWQGEVLRYAAEIARLREALANTSLAYDTGFQDGLGEAGQIARLRKRLASADAAVDAAAGWRYWLGHDELTERVNRALDDRAALEGGSE